MFIENSARVSANPTQVWKFMLDIPRVAACIPGIEDFEIANGTDFTGAIKIKVGPISLSLRGSGRVISQCAERQSLVLHGEGRDLRIPGRVLADVSVTLIGHADETELKIETTAQILGKIGEFGQPLIRRTADKTVQGFARRLADALKRSDVD